MTACRSTSTRPPRTNGEDIPSLLATAMPDGAVRCGVCAHRCLVRPGGSESAASARTATACWFSTAYGAAVAVAMDPIEKKPLFHVAPGTQAYSLATAGCPFHCVFCQNWEIAQGPRLGAAASGPRLPPDRAVADALELGARSIAYTYVEPTVFLEYALAIGRPARAAGLLNLFITDGYATPEAIDLLATVLDAANVDLKGFNEAFYRRRCGARLDHVLEALEALPAGRCVARGDDARHPGRERRPSRTSRAHRLARRRISGAETPWHVSRFFPAFRMQDRPPTPLEPRSVEPPRSGGRRACATSMSAMRPSSPWRTRIASGAASSSWPGAATGSSATSRTTGPARPAGAAWPAARSNAGFGRETRPMRMTPDPAIAAARRCGLRPSPAPSTRPIPRSWRRSCDELIDAARPPRRRPSRPRAGLRRHPRAARRAGLQRSPSRRPPGASRGRRPPRPDRPRPEPPPSCCSARTTAPGGSMASGSGMRAPGEPRSATSRWTRRSPRRSSALGPLFAVDRDAHRSEHSLEVQLPFVASRLPGARIVPLADRDRHEASGPSRPGDRLGALLAERRARGAQVTLAISTDMAHYPSAAVACPGHRGAGAGHPRAGSDGLGRREAEITLGPAGRGLRDVRHRADRRRARGAPRDGRRRAVSAWRPLRRPTRAVPDGRSDRRVALSGRRSAGDVQDRVRRPEVGVGEERAGVVGRHRRPGPRRGGEPRSHLRFDRQRAVDAGPDDEPAAVPGDRLKEAERRMPVAVAERLRRLLVTFAHGP